MHRNVGSYHSYFLFHVHGIILISNKNDSGAPLLGLAKSMYYA